MKSSKGIVFKRQQKILSLLKSNEFINVETAYLSGNLEVKNMLGETVQVVNYSSHDTYINISSLSIGLSHKIRAFLVSTPNNIAS